MNQKIIAGLLAGFFLIALLRVFSTPLKLALKLLLNTLLGFLALWAVNLTAAFTGVTLGLNLWNALIIGILGRQRHLQRPLSGKCRCCIKKSDDPVRRMPRLLFYREMKRRWGQKGTGSWRRRRVIR